MLLELLLELPKLLWPPTSPPPLLQTGPSARAYSGMCRRGASVANSAMHRATSAAKPHTTYS